MKRAALRRTVRVALVLVALSALSALATGCPKSSPPEADAGAPPASASAKPASVFAVIDASSGPGEPMNAIGAPASEIKKYVNPQGLPPYSGPTGAVEGTIWVKGPPAPAMPPADYKRCPGAEQIYGKKFREGPAREDGARPLADAVVAVTGYSGFFVPEKEENAQIAIVGCGFEQRTITMTFGQRLEVKNTSNEFWSPMLDPSPNPVIMMAPPRANDPVRLYPKRPGLLRLYDHDRTWAQADLYVLFHPLHAASKLDGHYRIDGLPLGKLKVNALHPAFEGEASQEIEIQPNVVVRADLVLEYVPKDAGPPNEDAGYRPKLR